MSWLKGEPQWMLDFRIKSHRRFERRPRPTWGGDTTGINFDDIYYYIKPTDTLANDWDMVPESIKNTYERLGIPEAERKYLAGVTAQYESEVVYHRNREDLEAQGVLFCDMDTALREYPQLVKKHFGTVIPPNDNKFSALNSAVWSGGSFIYVPPGVEVEAPLQAYFRINAENMGQFERTLIIADEGSKVHYIEGCSAPTYSTDSLHSAVVEIIVGRSARVTYTTIQNWSDNVYNLVTKRARVEAEGHMEWIDGNIGCLAEGSRVTTPGGTKPIELVMPGDEVLSYDEAAGSLCWRRVTAKRYSGEQPVRDVRQGSRRLRVTDNHPFYSYAYDASRPKKLGRYNLAYVRADQLEKAIVPISSLDYGEPHKLELPEAVSVFDTQQPVQRRSFVAERRRGRIATRGGRDHHRRADVAVRPVHRGRLHRLGRGRLRRTYRWAKVVFSVPRHGQGSDTPGRRDVPDHADDCAYRAGRRRDPDLEQRRSGRPPGEQRLRDRRSAQAGADLGAGPARVAAALVRGRLPGL